MKLTDFVRPAYGQTTTVPLRLQSDRPNDRANMPAIYRLTDRADMPAIYQPNDRADTPAIYERDNDRADMPTILITVVPICLRHKPRRDNDCAATPTVRPT